MWFILTLLSYIVRISLRRFHLPSVTVGWAGTKRFLNTSLDKTGLDKKIGYVTIVTRTTVVENEGNLYTKGRMIRRRF